MGDLVVVVRSPWKVTVDVVIVAYDGVRTRARVPLAAIQYTPPKTVVVAVSVVRARVLPPPPRFFRPDINHPPQPYYHHRRCVMRSRWLSKFAQMNSIMWDLYGKPADDHTRDPPLKKLYFNFAVGRGEYR